MPLYQYIHSTNNHVYLFICTMYRYNYKLLHNNVTRTMYIIYLYVYIMQLKSKNQG